MTDIVDMLRALRQEKQTISDAARHLTCWLEMDLCECDGPGHSCGYSEVRRTRDALLGILAQREACECHHCLRVRGTPLGMTKMVLCPICGNKRCPHASDHTLDCTNSNEPGQAGSIYPDSRLLPNCLPENRGRSGEPPV